MEVKCPTCRGPSAFDSGNPYRPFCCERCQTLDLGAWAEEKYRVPLDEGPIEGAFDQEIITVNKNSESSPVSSDDPPPKDLLN